MTSIHVRLRIFHLREIHNSLRRVRFLWWSELFWLLFWLFTYYKLFYCVLRSRKIFSVISILFLIENNLRSMIWIIVNRIQLWRMPQLVNCRSCLSTTVSMIRIVFFLWVSFFFMNKYLIWPFISHKLIQYILSIILLSRTIFTEIIRRTFHIFLIIRILPWLFWIDKF